MEITTKEKAQIAHGQMVCPVCLDQKNVWNEATTGVVPCDCMKWRYMVKMTAAGCSPHDRFAKLSTLKPSRHNHLPVATQQRVLEMLRKHPDDGYAFYGPAGTGKTTFCAALYRAAVKTVADNNHHGAPHSLWRVSMKQLLDAHVDYANRADKDLKYAPTVTAEKIQAAAKQDRRPRLFIEEIDKVKYSEFKENTLFDLLNEMMRHKGQLVLNANLTLGELSSLFRENLQEAMAHRIGELCKPVDFFAAMNGGE